MIQKAGISLCHIAFRGYHDALQLSSQDLDQAAHASRKCEGGGIRLYTSENLLIQLRYGLAKLSTFYSAKADHPRRILVLIHGLGVTFPLVTRHGSSLPFLEWRRPRYFDVFRRRALSGGRDETASKRLEIHATDELDVVVGSESSPFGTRELAAPEKGGARRVDAGGTPRPTKQVCWTRSIERRIASGRSGRSDGIGGSTTRAGRAQHRRRSWCSHRRRRNWQHGCTNRLQQDRSGRGRMFRSGSRRDGSLHSTRTRSNCTKPTGELQHIPRGLSDTVTRALVTALAGKVGANVEYLLATNPGSRARIALRH